jgi:cobalt-zinc-cadmium efflux system membrane fusion protein
LLLLFALVLFGCPSGTGEGAPRSDSSAKPQGQAAVEGAMCKEHGVLEVICTKCHPKLAAVFQAKGDWCPEHGFPESICPICHPERGGKPAVDVSAKAPAGEGDGPADGTKVRFKTKETARLAGIEVVKAQERSGGGGVLATAKLTYDATKLGQVNARSPGVVRSLKVDVGAKVKKGALLASIESAEVGADRSRLEAARARVDVAQKSYERQEMLTKEGITATKSLLEAQQELASARAEEGALRSSLSISGAGAGTGGGYSLTAPLAGVVTQRNVTVGKLVGTDALLFEIVDTSAMWAEIDIPETELSTIALDQAVVIHVDGLEKRAWKGVIRYISPEIDVHTRTARARVPLENPDGALRANMFARARILTGEARSTAMVPRAAVQRAKTVQLVFVRLVEDEYEARRVEIGIREDGLVEIIKGIKPGEEVVTQGSFLLKTETLKESIGAGCCDVD